MSLEGLPWLYGPVFDLTFFSALWLMPLILLLSWSPFGSHAYAAVLGYSVFHILLRLPHFVCTGMLTFLIPANRAYYREHWVQYYLIPVAILVLYTVVGVSRPTPVSTAIRVFGFFWGVQHVVMQNFGLMSLYRQRLSGPRDVVASQLERYITYFMVVALIFATIASAPALQGRFAFMKAVPGWMFVAASVTGCVHLLRSYVLRKTYAVSIPGTLYFVAAMIMMIPFQFYDKLGPFTFFFVFNGHHGIVYIGLTFLIDANRKKVSKHDRLPAFARFSFWTLIASSVLFALGVGYATLAGHPITKPNENTLGLLFGVFVSHYYLESRVWKFSNPHNRNLLMPLLRRV